MNADGGQQQAPSGNGPGQQPVGADRRLRTDGREPLYPSIPVAPSSQSRRWSALFSRFSLSRLLRWLGQDRETVPDYPSLDRAVYAVGDIHGRADLLADVHQRIDADRAERRLEDALEIYVGDYVDRGPDSRGVLELLIGRGLDRSIVCLRGNHDMAFLEFLRGQLPFELWRAIGGAATVESYGVSASGQGERVRMELADSVPPAHLNFLEHLPYFEVAGAYLFVHAGIRPGLTLDKQDFGDLMTVRDEFLDYGGRHKHIVVHGHTPVMAPELKLNRINIDTGAFATNRLTCLRIDKDGVGILQV